MKPSRPTDAQLVALLRNVKRYPYMLTKESHEFSANVVAAADALEAASAPDVRTFEQKVSHADEAAWESYRATRPWIRAYHELSPRDIMLRKQSTREMLRAAGCGEG